MYWSQGPQDQGQKDFLINSNYDIILMLCHATPHHTTFLFSCSSGLTSILHSTVDPRLTDGSTYRLFELQTSLATKFRFDLQPENRPTDQKKNPKWNKNGTKTAGYGINRFSMHCRSMETRPTDFLTCSHHSNTD